MRILLLTQYFAPEVGGAQVVLVSLARYLHKNGHKVVVVTAPPNYPSNQLYAGYSNRLFQKGDWEGMQLFRTWIYLPKHFGKLKRIIGFISFSFSCLLAIIAVGKVDVILVETPPFFLAFSAWIYGLFKRAPIVVQYSDLWVKAAIDFGYIPRGWPARFALWLENQALRRGQAIIAVTQGLVDNLQRGGIEPDKIHLIINGIDCSHYKPASTYSILRERLGLDNKFVVIFAGTFSHTNGLEVVLDAADLLRKDPSVVFVMVGDGLERKSLQQVAHQRGLINILFLGPQPEDALPEYLQIADVGLNTLRGKLVTQCTLSIKLFAYLACGLPVICTDRQEMRQLVTAAQVGILVAPEDPMAITQAIKQLQGDPVLRQRMGKCARVFAVKHFDRRAKSEEICKVLLNSRKHMHSSV